MNEALVLSSVRQHELVGAAESLNAGGCGRPTTGWKGGWPSGPRN